MSTFSHFSAGGQLLHPSEVKSSMSVLCVSSLSNTVAGIGDADRATMLIKTSGMLNLRQLAFMVADIAVKETGIIDPGYS